MTRARFHVRVIVSRYDVATGLLQLTVISSIMVNNIQPLQSVVNAATRVIVDSLVRCHT